MTRSSRRRLIVSAAVAVLATASFAYFVLGSVRLAPTAPYRVPVPTLRARTFEDVFARGRKVAFCTLETGRVHVPRSTMLRRSHTASDVAREHDPLPIFAHLVRHPSRGDVLIDTGLDASFVGDPYGNLRGPARVVHGAMHARFVLEPGTDIARQLARYGAVPRIAFFTHVHGDHTAGVPALPRTMRLVVGPHEHEDVAAYLGYGHVDGDRVIEVLDETDAFALAPFSHVIDLLGDASLLAIATPGHSRGHTSYLVNARSGPVLLVGDAAHTAFAFSQGIGPHGPTESDDVTGQHSLDALRVFSARHPEVRVIYGHELASRICDLDPQ